MPLFGPPDIEKLKQKRDIDGLVKALHDKREQQVHTPSGKQKRRTGDLAAEALIELRDPGSVPELIKIIDLSPGDSFENWMVVERAVKILGQLKDSRAIPPLVRALSKKPPLRISGARHPAVDALKQIGGPTILPLLLDCLDSLDPSLRENAVVALGELRYKEAVPTLVGLLADAQICRSTILALAAIGDTSVVPQLVQRAAPRDVRSTRGPDSEIRNAVFVALIFMQDTSGQAMHLAIEPLAAVLSRAGLKDYEDTIALHYLSTLDKPEVVPLLLASLPTLADRHFKWTIQNALAYESAIGYRWHHPFEDCANAIGRVGDKECIPQLERIRRRLDQPERDIVDKVIADLKGR